MENKLCKNCNIQKSLNEFPKMGGKLCSLCFNEYMRLRRPKKDKIKVYKDKKTCKKCNIEKDIQGFHGKLCLDCYKTYRTEYNKNYIITDERREYKKEYCKQYRKDNKEYFINYNIEYYKDENNKIRDKDDNKNYYF